MGRSSPCVMVYGPRTIGVPGGAIPAWTVSPLARKAWKVSGQAAQGVTSDALRQNPQ